MVGPLDEQRTILVHLRLFSLYKSGNVRTAREGVLSVRFGAHSRNMPSFWLSKLAVECYYDGDFQMAAEAWICAGRISAIEHPIPCVHVALASALQGDFVTAVALINQYQPQTKESKQWKLLVKGMALAGLNMYDQSLIELNSCIVLSSIIYVTAQAVALKRAIESRRLEPQSQWHQTQHEWILETHRQGAAASHPFIVPSTLVEAFDESAAIYI